MGRKIKEETKAKISLALKKYYAEQPPNPENIHKCEKCGDIFVKYIRPERKKHCESCKRNVGRRKDTYKLLDLSTRTIKKILRRMNIGCQICGWNESNCDIHHIEEKRNGINDENSNLIVICPNCHRLIHSEKKYTKEFLYEHNLESINIDWRDYYFN